MAIARLSKPCNVIPFFYSRKHRSLMLSSLAFGEFASAPRSRPAPGLFKVGVLGFFGFFDFFFPLLNPVLWV